MKKMMLIGKTGCGKTTLTQAILETSMIYKKTQALEYYPCIIDTPGEYIENRNYYNALIATSVDSDIIAFVQDSTDGECIFPPQFARIFVKPIIGIITKTDCIIKNIKRAEECLINAGVNEIIFASAIEGTGIEKIKEKLK